MVNNGGQRPVDRLKAMFRGPASSTEAVPGSSVPIRKIRGISREYLTLALTGLVALGSTGCEGGCEYDLAAPSVSGSFGTPEDDSVDITAFEIEARAGNREFAIAPGVEINPRLGAHYENNSPEDNGEDAIDPFQRRDVRR